MDGEKEYAGEKPLGNDAGQFVGTWKLVSMVRTAPDGARSRPFGDKPLGYLTYTRDGFMSALLMKEDRKSLGVPPEELLDAFRSGRLFISPRHLKAAARYIAALSSCVSYCGTYELRGERVVHHVGASLVPDWIGTDLERVFAMSGKSLTLTASSPGGEVMDLVWEKL